jgi:hypothetical protein
LITFSRLNFIVRIVVFLPVFSIFKVQGNNLRLSRRLLRETNPDTHQKACKIVPNLVVTREMSESAERHSAQSQAISLASCSVLQEIHAGVQHLQGYITENKNYCVYLSPGEDAGRQHAGSGGFAGSRISRIRSMMNTIRAERLKEAS